MYSETSTEAKVRVSENLTLITYNFIENLKASNLIASK